MTKISYTFYPKDWTYSDTVFELDLAERGLYRELIDLAMLNDNKVEVNMNVWARKFGSTKFELTEILKKLKLLNLIEITGTQLFIPSCESRLVFVRKGSKGGSAKNTNKGFGKPLHKPNSKPIHKEKKDKDKRKEKGGFLSQAIPFKNFWEMYGKKEGFNYTEGYWNNLDPETQKEIMNFLPKYIASKPNPRYRKKPENFLIDETWKEELPEMNLSEIKDKNDPRFKLLTRDQKIKWIKANIKF